MANGSVQSVQPIYTPLPSGTKLFVTSLSFYLSHWPMIVGVSLIPVLFAALPVVFGDESADLGIGTVLIFGLAVAVRFLARLALFDAVVEDGAPEGGVVGAYLKGIRKLWPFAIVGGLVSLATLGGFFLFVIPGALLAVWLSLSLYALFAENRR